VIAHCQEHICLALSFLDKGPLDGSERASQALSRSLLLPGEAKSWAIDASGLPSITPPKLASSSPEVLIGHLLAYTQRIRICDPSGSRPD